MTPSPPKLRIRDAFGSRASVRRVLYMAALIATRHNLPLRPAYRRIVASGKKKVPTVTAIIRTLLVMLSAIIRDQNPCRNLSVQP